jgi:hypothetical protein
MWSAGHGIERIDDVPTVDQFVERLAACGMSDHTAQVAASSSHR